MTTILKTNFDDIFGLALNDFRFTKSIIKDMHPYEIKTKDNMVIIAYQTVGIDKKDVKVSLKTEYDNSYLVIEGKTTNKELEKDFSVFGKFVVNKPSEIEKVKYKVENGLVYVYIYNKEHKIDVEIEEI